MYVHKGLSIAVIDDDPKSSEAIVKLLKKQFNESIVNVYQSGRQALEGIINEPDIIILDYHLNAIDSDNLNGIQVLVKLKERFQHAPVIFLSNQEDAEVAAHTIKFGAYDYIVNNENAFHPLEIVINNILGHAELKKNLGSQRFFNILLVILFVILLIGYLIYRMK